MKLRYAVSGILTIGLVLAIWYQVSAPDQTNLGHHLRNYQEADAPVGHPVLVEGKGESQYRNAAFDPRFAIMQAEELFVIPTIHHFDPPFEEDERGALTAPATGLVLRAGETLVLGHRLPGGEVVQSVFHEVEGVKVTAGSLVLRGRSLATSGAFLGLSSALVIGKGVRPLAEFSLPTAGVPLPER